MSATESLSLEKFTEKYGYITAAYIFHVSHKQIWWWIEHRRELRVIQVNGSYHAWGSRFLGKITEQELNKFRVNNPHRRIK